MGPVSTVTHHVPPESPPPLVRSATALASHVMAMALRTVQHVPLVLIFPLAAVSNVQMIACPVHQRAFVVRVLQHQFFDKTSDIRHARMGIISTRRFDVAVLSSVITVIHRVTESRVKPTICFMRVHECPADLMDTFQAVVSVFHALFVQVKMHV